MKKLNMSRIRCWFSKKCNRYSLEQQIAGFMCIYGPPPVMSMQVCLTKQDGAAYQEKIDTTLMVGRGKADNQLTLEGDNAISRQQFMLKQVYNELEIENKSITNPTMVNGIRLDSPQILQQGDCIQVGRSSYIITWKFRS